MESELTAQEFIAARGDYKLAIRVAAGGEGHLKVDGRKISLAENAKDSRQALRGLAEIAEQYFKEHTPKAGINLTAFPGREVPYESSVQCLVPNSMIELTDRPLPLISVIAMGSSYGVLPDGEKHAEEAQDSRRDGPVK